MSNNLMQTLQTVVLIAHDDDDSIIQAQVYGGILFSMTKSRVKKMWIRYLKKVLGSGNGAGRRLERSYIFEEKLKHRLFEKVQSIVPPFLDFQGKQKLYDLWVRTSFISPELFADAFTETGMYTNLYNCHEWDEIWGASGDWNPSLDRGICFPAATPHLLKKNCTFGCSFLWRKCLLELSVLKSCINSSGWYLWCDFFCQPWTFWCY